jgi:hypothetical protein
VCEDEVKFHLPAGQFADLAELWVINSERESRTFSQAVGLVSDPSGYLQTQRLAPNFADFSPVPIKSGTHDIYNQIRYSYPSAGQTLVVSVIWEKKIGSKGNFTRLYGVAQVVNGCEPITNSLKFIATNGTPDPEPVATAPAAKAPVRPPSAPAPVAPPADPVQFTHEDEIHEVLVKNPTGPVTLTALGKLTTPVLTVLFPRLGGVAVTHTNTTQPGATGWTRNEYVRRRGAGDTFVAYYQVLYVDFVSPTVYTDADANETLTKIFQQSGDAPQQIALGTKSIAGIKGRSLMGTVNVPGTAKTAYVYERIAFADNRMWMTRVVCASDCGADATSFFGSIVVK